MGLTWAPPTGYAGFTSYTIAADGTGTLSTTSSGVVTHTLSDSVDYKISAPATITSPIIIKGGRNVVWIAGRITIGYQGAFASGQRRRAIHIGSGTASVSGRIVHLEGILMDGADLADAVNVGAPEAIVQVENCRADSYHFRSCDDRDSTNGYTGKGTHPDGIQPWGGCQELRIDGYTCKSAYQGLYLNTIESSVPAGSDIARIRRYNWEGVGFTSTEEGPVTGGSYSTNVVRSTFDATSESWSFGNSGTQSLAQTAAEAQSGAGSLAATRTFATTFDQVWVRSPTGQNIGSDTALKCFVKVPAGTAGTWTARLGYNLSAAAGSTLFLSSAVSVTPGVWTQVICDIGANGHESSDVDRFVVQVQRASGTASSITVYIDTVSSGSISGYTYGGPSTTYYGIRALSLDTMWGDVYLDEGSVYTKHHVNSGWAATSNTNTTAKAGSGFYWTRRYEPAHGSADVNGYVLDPPPGTARFQDTLYPPPDVVTATYATWTTEPRIKNWDGTGDGRVYSGAAAGGDYVPAATVGTSYVSPGYGAETPGSAVVYSADPLSGTANSPTLPAGWTGSGSTGWVTKMNSDGVGIVMQSGVLGTFNDYVRLDLAAAGTTAMTDYEIFAWWYWNNPLVSETVAFYIRSSDDWANSNNPATWVRTQINNTGAADIRHRLSSGTQNLDASATVTVTNGVSQKVRLRVVGNNIYARYWDNNLPEPSGWTMGPVAMTTDIVSGPGRSKVVLIGGSAAASVSARLRSFIVTDLTADVPTPPAPTFIPSAGRLSVQRGRRRR